MAVNMVAAGRAEAGGALVELAGLAVLPALAEANAPAPALRSAIEAALLEHYRQLPGFTTRARFTAWCRQAEFSVPAGLPETLDIYRGTMGCSPAAAATGLHWTTTFEMAALYACRFADAALTGVIVLHARVPCERVAAFLTCVMGNEVIPAEVPTDYEVITDHQRIGDAAVRWAARQNELWAQGGWLLVGGTADSLGRRGAMSTRARMAAAGVPRGAAIVA
jgi:hypothetical protein